MLSDAIIIDTRKELSVKYKKALASVETSVSVVNNLLEAYKYIQQNEPDLIIISDSIPESLEEFCNKTKLYSYNAKKFKEIVNKVETKNIEPSKLACKVQKILEKKNPKFAYKINANFYLRLLSKMPKKFQFWVIKKVLKKDK